MIDDINRFLALKRFALIGASRSANHFSRLLMKEFETRGLEVLPINPEADEIDGKPCCGSVGAIPTVPEGAMVMISGTGFTEAVQQCIDSGVKIIWLVRSGAPPEIREAAVEACESVGVTVIDGACPLMYIKDTAVPHAIHGWIWKLVGKWGR